MKNLYLSIIVTAFFSHASAQCLPPQAQTDLDIANVRAKIMTGGDMWWDLIGSPEYEVPKGSGKHSLFGGGIWMGALDDNGQLRVAAQTYRQSGYDFWPGPIDSFALSISPATCIQFDRHWKLTRAEVEDFASGGNPTPAIIDYPGGYAPYVDVNGDGMYDYLDGDYPMFDEAGNQSGCNCTALHGDQVLWWVMNDIGNLHTASNSPFPLGIEIRSQAFAFASADEDISNATFYEYKIINHQTNTRLDSTWMGFFVDVEIGDYLDDYVGCDVGRGLGYGYNGDFSDGGVAGYGANPPAIGLDVIHGPAADAGDGIDNDRDSCLDCTFLKDGNGVIIDTIPDTVFPELIKMSRFVYYNNNNHPVNGNPSSATDYYAYLRGIWRNGFPMTYGGDGKGGGSGATPDPCYFMYPGNSDPYNWGTNGIPESEWNEVIAGNIPDDRRFLSSVGPFTMLPGAVQCVQTAVLWARDTSGPISSVEKLKFIDDKIGGGSLDCANFPTGVLTTSFIATSVYPVPVNDLLHFTFSKSIASGTIRIYDIHGKLLAEQKFSGDRINLNCKELVSAIYFYEVLSENKSISSGKFMKN